MTSVFDWKSEKATCGVRDMSAQQHLGGKRLQMIALATQNVHSVGVYDLTGKKLKQYPSISSAARDQGISCYRATRCIKGEVKSVDGRVFKEEVWIDKRRGPR